MTAIVEPVEHNKVAAPNADRLVDGARAQVIETATAIAGCVSHCRPRPVRLDPPPRVHSTLRRPEWGQLRSNGPSPDCPSSLEDWRFALNPPPTPTGSFEQRTTRSPSFPLRDTR